MDQRIEFVDQSSDPVEDGAKITKTMNDLNAEKEKLTKLYEHWEEAIELGG